MHAHNRKIALANGFDSVGIAIYVILIQYCHSVSVVIINSVLPEIGFGGMSLFTDSCMCSNGVSRSFTLLQFMSSAGMRAADRRISKRTETDNIFT